MYLMIDNYDSFVYNLKAYFEELGHEILVKRNDEVTLKEVRSMAPEGIIISPGPGRPEQAGISAQLVREFSGEIPILGVCLGHQTIGYTAGAHVKKGKRPMHGKVTEILHSGRGIFQGLPQNLRVTRYHSLVVEEYALPIWFTVDAKALDGAVMAISHRRFPVYGVQFHPEAVLTEYGHELLENFHQICVEWNAGKQRMAAEWDGCAGEVCNA